MMLPNETTITSSISSDWAGSIESLDSESLKNLVRSLLEERLLNDFSKASVGSPIIEFLPTALEELGLSPLEIVDVIRGIPFRLENSDEVEQTFAMTYTARNPLFPFESSTKPEKRFANLDQSIEAIFEAAKDEIFEDGMDTEFSRQLELCILKYGRSAIDVITRLIIPERIDEEIATEALHVLSHIDQPTSYPERLWLLAQSLFSSSASIRHSAALGLGAFDDPEAIRFLQRALQKEKVIAVGKIILKVLAQLEDTLRWRSSLEE